MAKVQKLNVIYIFAFLLLLAHPVEGDDTQFINSKYYTSDLNDKDSIKSETGPYPFHHLLTLGAIRIYQKFISPIKASTCPMHPSCSVYGYEAFKHYNPLKAFAMTADRLLRDRHDLDNYEKVEISGSLKFFDPVTPSLAVTPLKVSPIILPSLIFKEIDSSELDSSIDANTEDSRLFHFARALESAGDYQRALTEYYRLIFNFPDSPYSKEAKKSIIHCYYKAEQYLSAIDWGEELLIKGSMAEEENEIKFFIGLSYLKLGNTRTAREYFDEIITSGSNEFNEKGILLKGFSYAREGKWEEAKEAFAQIRVDSKFFDNAKQAIELSEEGKNLRKKSPFIAGILGIIPGLGYLYSGYEQTAIASFIVNGLFMWGTIEAFKQKNEGLGVMLAIFSTGFYSGNIYGSIMSAQRSNIKSQNDLILKFNLGFEY